VILKLCDSEPLQVQACSRLYSVWNMHTNTSLNVCDLKRSSPKGVREMCGAVHGAYYTDNTT
jgi:hypothetical protein